jgi:hypothetical protein
VPRADDYPLFGIELALRKRPVVVGATVLDRAELTVQVEDAHGDRARTNDLHRPRRELIHRSNVDQSQLADLELFVEARPLLRKGCALRAVERDLQDAEPQ